MNERTDSLEEFVATTIAELVHCRRDEVGHDAALVEIGVDSLSITTLATFVEAEYGCTFAPSQLRTLYRANRVDDVLLAVRQVVCSDTGSVASSE